jgi:hypothetical protein
VSSECEQSSLFTPSEESISGTQKWVEYIGTVKTYFILRTNEFLRAGKFKEPGIIKFNLRSSVA